MWYKFPVAEQRVILMMLQYAQQEIRFTGFNIISCSMETFATVGGLTKPDNWLKMPSFYFYFTGNDNFCLTSLNFWLIIRLQMIYFNFLYSKITSYVFFLTFFCRLHGKNVRDMKKFLRQATKKWNVVLFDLEAGQRVNILKERLLLWIPKSSVVKLHQVFDWKWHLFIFVWLEIINFVWVHWIFGVKMPYFDFFYIPNYPVMHFSSDFPSAAWIKIACQIKKISGSAK